MSDQETETAARLFRENSAQHQEIIALRRERDQLLRQVGSMSAHGFQNQDRPEPPETEEIHADVGFQPGDVVCCYPDTEFAQFGVVRYYEPVMNYYRVRISTTSADEFVEMGVSRQFLCYAEECDGIR